VKKKKRRPPEVVTVGSVSVRIYFTPSHGSDSYTLCYYQDGVRHRPTFPDLERAKKEAKIVASRLGSRDADVLALTSGDRAAYLRARELLGSVGVSIEAAVAQFVEAKKALGQVPLTRAVDYYLRRHPKQMEAKTVKEVVDECVAAKRADGMGERYLQSLRYRLGKFAKAFHCDINAVSGHDIEKWLRELGTPPVSSVPAGGRSPVRRSSLGPRSRNNIRNSVQLLFNFAKSRRYVPKDHDEMESVPVAKDRGGKIEVFTPEEMQEILNCASKRFIAFLALGAFAGVRHAEIVRLEWKDIRFEDGLVEIHAAKAKTASRRTIPLLDNLRQWLWPLRQKSGFVCAYRSMSTGLNHVVQEVNKARKKREVKERLAWKRNGLRHSYISYRVAQTQNVAQVALEAGNSPKMIFRHYRELVPAGDALKWFSIAPNQKGVEAGGAV